MGDITNRIENIANILTTDTNKINNLPNYLDTSDATAKVTDLVTGVTAYVNGEKITGTVTNSVSGLEFITNVNVIDNSKSNTIMVNGYHTFENYPVYMAQGRNLMGHMKIPYANITNIANITPNVIKNGVNILGVMGTLSEGIDTSDATATAENIIEGATAYVNGVKITGTMENLSNTITEQENIIANLQNIVNNKASGGSLELTDGSKLAYSTFKDYPNYDVSNIKDMSNMFYQCENLENISNLNMTNATSIYNMFQGCWSLSTDTCNNIANFIPNSNQIDVKTIYEAGIEASRFDSEAKEILYNKGYLDTYNGYEDMIEVYNICADGTWTNDLTPEYGYPSTIYGGGLTGLLSQYTLWETTNIIVESNKLNAVLLMMSNMFQYKTSLTDLILNINTANLLVMSSTFEGCESLVNISNFDTSNVINMSGAFTECSSLENLPNFDTSNVTNMYETFKKCENLVNIPNFNTINVTNMVRTFSQTGINTIPNFNTSNVTNMGFMFMSCYNLESIPNFNTINVKYMSGTFIDCAITNVPNFDTSNVVEMASTFWNCTNLTDVPQFNTSNVNTMGGMFGGCNNLSNASIQNIINMCLNSNVPEENRTLVTDAYSSPFFQTQFDNSYYTNRLTELDTAGWTY